MGQDSEVYRIRLSDQEAAAILDRLDAEQLDDENGQRRSSRHPLRGMEMVVAVAQQGQPAVSHQVKTRNVSQHGLAFITTAAMLPGTMITVHFPTGKGGEPVRKEAIVRRSRLVQGVVYEIGAEFCSFAKTLAEQDRKQSAGAEGQRPDLYA